jgi:hypothetical protein
MLLILVFQWDFSIQHTTLDYGCVGKFEITVILKKFQEKKD